MSVRLLPGVLLSWTFVLLLYCTCVQRKTRQSHIVVLHHHLWMLLKRNRWRHMLSHNWIPKMHIDVWNLKTKSKCSLRF
jgi:hypothetical protein